MIRGFYPLQRSETVVVKLIKNHRAKWGIIGVAKWACTVVPDVVLLGLLMVVIPFVADDLDVTKLLGIMDYVAVLAPADLIF
jgi:hypothetical protein